MDIAGFSSGIKMGGKGFSFGGQTGFVFGNSSKDSSSSSTEGGFKFGSSDQNTKSTSNGPCTLNSIETSTIATTGLKFNSTPLGDNSKQSGIKFGVDKGDNSKSGSGFKFGGDVSTGSSGITFGSASVKTDNKTTPISDSGGGFKFGAGTDIKFGSKTSDSNNATVSMTSVKEPTDNQSSDTFKSIFGIDKSQMADSGSKPPTSSSTMSIGSTPGGGFSFGTGNSSMSTGMKDICI